MDRGRIYSRLKSDVKWLNGLSSFDCQEADVEHRTSIHCAGFESGVLQSWVCRIELFLNFWTVQGAVSKESFILMVPPGKVAIGARDTSLEINSDSSLADHPSSILSRHLRMLAVVFICILNRRHTVDSWRATELNALVCGALLHGRVLLEDALGRARVDVRVTWHLERRETLGGRARG